MSLTKEVERESPWLLLVFSLGRKSASLRVTIWRKLQRNGSLPLGNSGYLIPNSPENRERFEWLATTIRSHQGEASIVEVQSIDNCSRPQLIRRFRDARTGDYQELFKDLREVSRAKNSMATTTRLRQRFREITSIDFFGSPVRKQLSVHWTSYRIPKESGILRTWPRFLLQPIETGYGSPDPVQVSIG